MAKVTVKSGLYQICMELLGQGRTICFLYGALYDDEQEARAAAVDLNQYAKENDFTNVHYFVKTLKKNSNKGEII